MNFARDESLKGGLKGPWGQNRYSVLTADLAEPPLALDLASAGAGAGPPPTVTTAPDCWLSEVGEDAPAVGQGAA